MQIIITNSQEQTLTLPDDNFILQEWNGFASLAHSLKTSKAPKQIGATVINRIFSPRNLNIQFAIKVNNSRQEVFDYRREIIDILNPCFEEGTLKWVQNDDTIRQIDIEVDSLQMPGGDAQGQNFQIVQLDLLCPDPRWYDENITTENILADSTATLYNQGDTKTYCEITLDGPVVKPTITNLSVGKTIKINYDLQIDEKMIINTEFGEKKVTFENESGQQSWATYLLDLDSRLFYLKSGANTIETNADAEIKYYQRYVGV